MNAELSADEDVTLFFERVAQEMAARFDMKIDEAERLAGGYYRRFNDDAVMREIGLVNDDPLTFFEDSAVGMALRVYYSMVLGGQSDPDTFIAWRTAYYQARTAGEKAVPALPA